VFDLITNDSVTLYFIDFYKKRDRFRTSINVWGDSVGAGIVDHLSRKELANRQHVDVEDDNELSSLNDKNKNSQEDRYETFSLSEF
jgi:solute carrier family 1 (glial high affinity glutamate transporter), member 3